MTIHAVPTISDEIYLQEISEKVKRLEGSDCPKKDMAWVRVRQATESDQLQVSQRNSGSEVLWLADGSAKEKRDRNVLEDRMFRAYLVLVDVGNIVDKNGDPVFEFAESGDYPKFKGTFSKFQDKWGVLQSSVADAIEMAIYKLNPQWDVFGLMREDDEEGE